MALTVKIDDYAVSTSTVTYTVPTPTDNNGKVFAVTLRARTDAIRIWDNETEANTGTDNYFTLAAGDSISLNAGNAQGTVLYMKRNATDAVLEVLYLEGIGT